MKVVEKISANISGPKFVTQTHCCVPCGGGGGGYLRVILERVCGPVFLKPTPIIYMVFEKNDLFIYLIEQNVHIFIYCSLIFIYPLCCL